MHDLQARTYRYPLISDLDIRQFRLHRNVYAAHCEASSREDARKDQKVSRKRVVYEAVDLQKRDGEPAERMSAWRTSA